MRDEEYTRWAFLIEDLIRGEHVELLCPTVNHARCRLLECMRILDEICLPYDARRSPAYMAVRVSDGDIEFIPETLLLKYRCRP